ncbi:hypothetical protein B0H13DRAFT_2054289, partial [Mycena leptocephala]
GGYARYGREEMVRRSGSWSGARASDGGPSTIRGRRGGRGEGVREYLKSRISAVSRHRARTPREVLRGSALCDKQGETEGTQRLHPRDWPASRGYEVQELEHGYRRNREVYSRVRDFFRSHSAPQSRLARMKLPTTRLRRWGSDCEQQEGAEEGGYAWVRTGGDGQRKMDREKELELERGKGRRRRAVRRRRGGRGCLFCRSGGERRGGGDVRGMELER